MNCNIFAILVFMRDSSHFAQRLQICYDISYMDLCFACNITGIHHKIVGGHLIIVSSWPYAGKNDIQACSCGTYGSFFFLFV